jgi:helix-turn-helix protein
MSVRQEETRPDVPVFGHEFEYDFSMQLRYNYRLYPAPRQQVALARTFGCARVVFNDGLRARKLPARPESRTSPTHSYQPG